MEETLGNMDSQASYNEKHRHERYLTSDPKEFFQPPIMGPDDSTEPLPWFLREIVRLLKTEIHTPSKSSISFEVSTKSASENVLVLERHGWDLSRLIAACPDSRLGYGSEFQSVKELSPLLSWHDPNFAALSNLITQGMPYVFEREIGPATKRKEMQTLLE